MRDKESRSTTTVFYICLVCAIGLMVGGFLAPPTGVIDGSVITSCGLLFLFAALGVFARSLDLNKSASFTKGDVSINVGGNQEPKELESNTENNTEL